MWTTQSIKLRAAYRARRLANTPSLVADLWYPPAETVKSIGRANDIEESVLYISDSEGTAILEMRPRVTEIFCVLQMVPLDSTQLPHVFDIGLGETSGGGSLAVRAMTFHQSITGRALLRSEENVAKMDLIRSFLVGQFTRIVEQGCNHEYGLALAIAKFHRDPDIDGIWYPSIAGGLRGTNAALTAVAADRLLRPSACWMIKIEDELPDRRYRVKCIAKASRIDAEGKIYW